MNRIQWSDSEELIRARVIQKTTQVHSLNSRTFYFAEVIDNNDPKNSNRIKCRIPIIDDGYYLDSKNEDEGNDKLPWCVPTSNRFIETPEIGAMVLIAVFDNKTPHFGRMYLSVFSNYNENIFFDVLEGDKKIEKNWKLIEDIFDINILSKPIETPFKSYKKNNNNINKVGIRGKFGNRIVLDKDKIELIQNLKSNNSSNITISENINIHSYDNIEIISSKGKKQHYNPVFDEPLFDYLSEINKLLKKIITVLNTNPAISTMGPCTPGKSAPNLIKDLIKLSSKFTKFKKEGSSEKITIN